MLGNIPTPHVLGGNSDSAAVFTDGSKTKDVCGVAMIGITKEMDLPQINFTTMGFLPDLKLKLKDYKVHY